MPENLFGSHPGDYPIDRIFIDNLPQTVFEIGTDGYFVYSNDLGLNTFGYTREDLEKGIHFINTVVESERPVVMQRFSDPDRGEKFGGFIYTAVRKDGTTFPVMIHSKQIMRGDKRHVMGIVFDISTVKESQNTLEAQVAKTEAIVNAIHDIIFILDEDGMYVDVLAAEESLLFAEKSKLIGKKLHEMLPIDVADYALAAVREAVRSGEAQILEYQLNVISGLRWFEGRTAPLKSHGGDKRLVVFAVHDITDRKQAQLDLQKANDELEKRVQQRTLELETTNLKLREEIARHKTTSDSLQTSEYEFHKVFSTVQDIVVSINTDGNIINVNPAFERITGYPVKEWIGRNFLGLIHPEDRQKAHSRFANRLEENLLASSEYRIITADGEVKQIEAALSQDCRGDRLLGISGIVRDVTERKKTEAALIRAERMAAVGVLSAGVAHEFNNIHTSLLGFLELALGDAGISENTRSLLLRVQKAAHRAADVTRNLLAFSRPKSTEHISASINTVVMETLTLVKSEFESSGVKISLNLGKPPQTSMDVSQIGQVAMNLLINAHHATLGEDIREINISTGLENGRVFLRVKDSGCGIPEENLARLFLPFFSTKGEHAPKNSTQTVVKGTGLGLSVCDTIVRAHGGEIVAENLLEGGSRFTVWLPVTGKVINKKKTTSIIRKYSGGRVLILDDEEDIRLLLADILKPRKCSYFTTGSGFEALREHRRDPFDLVIVDLQMPEMSGSEFIQRMVEEFGEKAPVCMVMTGRSQNEDEDEGLRDLPISGFIRKPFLLDELYRQIDAVMI